MATTELRGRRLVGKKKGKKKTRVEKRVDEERKSESQMG